MALSLTVAVIWMKLNLLVFRISLFIYLSKSYKENNPYIVVTFSTNQSKFFSNV